ncbi:VOC family protein [Dactylosporangium sp. NPDC051485]|uniref:VOC family protein n=1 Tax=Dactylosporangium sp. NPDC051485 TaxID=3154846 RepID=UPI00341EEB63
MSTHLFQAAVAGLGWRYVLGTLRATVAVASLAEAARAAAACAAVTGDARLDLRPDRLVLTLEPCTAETVALAGRLTEALRALDLATVPAQTQRVEIGVDALDIPAVRPFWKAALAYVDTPDGPDAHGAPLIDPLDLAPAVWFQQMDAPRPQRNRLHLDVSVPHDEAESRLRAALDAGGTLVSAAHAPAFWVLADAEGNELCITTWQGRDG